MCPFGGRRDEAGAKSQGLPRVPPVCVRIAFSLIGRRFTRHLHEKRSELAWRDRRQPMISTTSRAGSVVTQLASLLLERDRVPGRGVGAASLSRSPAGLAGG